MAGKPTLATSFPPPMDFSTANLAVDFTGVAVADAYGLIFVGSKPSTSQTVTPDGWEILADSVSSLGIGSGIDVGDTRLTVFGKVLVGNETTLTLTNTTNNVSWATRMVPTKPADDLWDVVGYAGRDTVNDNYASVSNFGNTPLVTGDLLISALAIPTDANVGRSASRSSDSNLINEDVFGPNSAGSASSSGQDIGAVLIRGEASRLNATFNYSRSVNVSGGTNLYGGAGLVRLRCVDAEVAPAAAFSGWGIPI